MHKIKTHLWFDKEAKEAAALYVSIFDDSKIIGTSVLENTPSGNVDVVNAVLCGQEFTLLAAGPYFKFNPSISFHIKVNSVEKVDEIWSKLIKGGKALMELGEYPFSKRYGWLEDKFGLSWQVIYAGDKEAGGVKKQEITPVLMFVGNVAGKAEEAISLYANVFHDSRVVNIMRYGKNEEPEKEGTVKYAAFILENKEFGALDSSNDHKFAFNEAISFMVYCKDQKEIDYYWEKLSAQKDAEQCGWLKDKFGVSWQIVPEILDKMMSQGNEEQKRKVTEAFLKMKKFDITGLKKAYEG